MIATEPPSRRVAAVVLSGGASSRFGADKLAAPIGGIPLLERALTELPTDWLVILVGPNRRLPDSVTAGRTILTARERPAGSGPAAALVAGITAALSVPDEVVRRSVAIVVTLPGDAPRGGAAAMTLVEALTATVTEPGEAVVGVDHGGVEQPLQFAATAAVASRLAAVTDTAGRPARSLLAHLGPYRPITLPAELTADIDVPDDVARFRP